MHNTAVAQIVIWTQLTQQFFCFFSESFERRSFRSVFNHVLLLMILHQTARSTRSQSVWEIAKLWINCFPAALGAPKKTTPQSMDFLIISKISLSSRKLLFWCLLLSSVALSQGAAIKQEEAATPIFGVSRGSGGCGSTLCQSSTSWTTAWFYTHAHTGRQSRVRSEMLF